MLRFTFEHRSNGLTYVTVHDEEKIAGSFAGAREDVEPVLQAIGEAAPVDPYEEKSEE